MNFMHILCVPEWASVLLLHWNGFKTWFYWVSRANPLNRMISPHKKQTFPTTKILKCCYVKMAFVFGHWVRTGSLKWSHVFHLLSFALPLIFLFIPLIVLWKPQFEWVPVAFFVFVDFAAVLSYLNAQKSKKQNKKMMWN